MALILLYYIKRRNSYLSIYLYLYMLYIKFNARYTHSLIIKIAQTTEHRSMEFGEDITSMT